MSQPINLSEPLRVYFAGKVRKTWDDYRSRLFQDPRVLSSNIGTEMTLFQGNCKELPWGIVKYWGPSALSCNHGCWHESDHGIVNPYDETKDFGSGYEHFHTAREPWPRLFTESERDGEGPCPNSHRTDNGLSRRQAVERCKFQILQAEAMYAYIDSHDCYGTISEIGYANALGIPIHLVFALDLLHSKDTRSWGEHGWEIDDHDDFWFIKQMASSVSYGKEDAGLEHIVFDPKRKHTQNAWKRIGVGPKKRVEVLVRDNYTCQMCGASRSSGAVLEIDHIHPVSKGGTNDLSNLQVLCRDCNAGKSNQILPMP
jgi:hypothetical protein